MPPRTFKCISHSPFIAIRTSSMFNKENLDHFLKVTMNDASITSLISVCEEILNTETPTFNYKKYQRLKKIAISHMSSFITSVTPRGGNPEGDLPLLNKLDFALSESWIENMRTSCPLIMKQIERAIADAYVINPLFGRCQFWHLLITFPGAHAQPEHSDNADDDSYATILIDLHEKFSAKRGTTCFVSHPKLRCTASLFDGNALHYGGANNSKQIRISLVISLTNETHDPNDN